MSLLLRIPAILLASATLLPLHAAEADRLTTVVRDETSLTASLRALRPGSIVRIAPGEYRPGILLRNVHGSAESPILIEALDPARPPVFRGGSQAWHLSGLSHVHLRGLTFTGQAHNGINIDDAGHFERPSHHITLENLRIEDTGPTGNFDAIKCSGVQHLRILDCHIHGWGGQAIDLVGCHHVEIARCRILGKEGFSQATGPQCKGGTSHVLIHYCHLENAGQRAIHIGGSTGEAFFRPQDAPWEASHITVRDNLILGSDCAVAFTGARNSRFLHNTIIHPRRWVLRILQESRSPRFLPCGDNHFHHNLVLYHRTSIREALNIGPDTLPASFSFSHNHWFAPDDPARSLPTLPSPETNPTHGIDPLLDPATHLPRQPLPAGRRPPEDAREEIPPLKSIPAD